MSAFEKHYRIGELAVLWKAGRETVRLLFLNEPGVVKINMGRKKKHTTYLIPESIAIKVHTRLTSG
jgi:RNA-binding protein YhbY